MSARRSRSYIGGKHRARLKRLEKAKAIKPTAHELARLIWMMLNKGQAYVERGIETFKAENRNRKIANLERRVRAPNMGLIDAGSGEIHA